MSRSSYQYETSPRKYEPDYDIPRKRIQQTRRKNSTKKTTAKKQTIKTNYQIKKEKQKAEKLKHLEQICIVLVIFGMLLAVSYREISIMEMFNNKKKMENELALIQKENGQVEKDIKAQESKLDWNMIKQKATEELGMQEANKITLELDKSDNVEKEVTLIKSDNTSFIEKLIEKFIVK